MHFQVAENKGFILLVICTSDGWKQRVNNCMYNQAADSKRLMFSCAVRWLKTKALMTMHFLVAEQIHAMHKPGSWKQRVNDFLQFGSWKQKGQLIYAQSDGWKQKVNDFMHKSENKKLMTKITGLKTKGVETGNHIIIETQNVRANMQWKSAPPCWSIIQPSTDGLSTAIHWLSIYIIHCLPAAIHWLSIYSNPMTVYLQPSNDYLQPSKDCLSTAIHWRSICSHPITIYLQPSTDRLFTAIHCLSTAIQWLSINSHPIKVYLQPSTDCLSTAIQRRSIYSHQLTVYLQPSNDGLSTSIQWLSIYSHPMTVSTAIQWLSIYSHPLTVYSHPMTVYLQPSNDGLSTANHWLSSYSHPLTVYLGENFLQSQVSASVLSALHTMYNDSKNYNIKNPESRFPFGKLGCN